MRLSAKLLVVVGTIMLVGFGALGTILLSDASDDLISAHHQRTEAVAKSVATGIQNIMLTGKAVHAEELVHDTRELPGVYALQIFDHEGHEVYLPREKRTGDLNETVARVLETGQAKGDDVRRVAPLANGSTCMRCHEETGPWRGAIAIGLSETTPEALVSIFAEAALQNVMLSGEAEEVNGFLERLEQLPMVHKAVVLGPDASLTFGREQVLDPSWVDAAKGLMREGGDTQIGDTHLFSVPNASECHVCHGDEDDYRGVIGIEVATRESADPLEIATVLFEKSLLQLMESERGNDLDSYLRQLRSNEAIQSAQLYDPKAVEVYPAQVQAERLPRGPRSEDEGILQALHTGDPTSFTSEHLATHLVPLPNEVRCQACHGSDHEVRGLVRVDADLRPAHAEVRDSVQRASLMLAVFVLLASFLLFLIVRAILVRPVIQVGRVAEKVGAGDLSVEVAHRSGDELGQLSRQMNDMIIGLRSKLMMERFVGAHTRRMIDDSVRGYSETRAPVRRAIAVLFSDVRGFTSYSEKHPPERVIETLNVYLGIQADVIRQYGGYVDKFVGDEIMALFEGENKEARAVRAADAMLKAVRDANAIDRMAIGIGVNAGEVVFGSTGSTGRQDYTVIGDVVNMAARLCSAAAAGVVLVSEDVQHAACDIASFSTPESLKLKGKSKALPIYTLLEVHPDHLGGEGIDSGVSDNE